MSTKDLPTDRDIPTRTRAEPGGGLGRGFVALGLVLAPSLLAIGLTPGFSTQDGPAHVYSARILNASLGANSPFAATFRVAWEPLPNWAGHLLTMLAVAVCSPEVANRVMAAATLVGFASAVVWLRWVVAGRAGIEVAAVLAALLALNVTWLLGFTSFLVGATLAPLTLGYWWSRRDRFRFAEAVVLGVFLVIGYFSHPISLGLTLAGLATLGVFTPGSDRWDRLGRTALGGIPLVPLALAYWSLTRSGGALEPVWKHWTPWSIAGCISQVGWVDPLSLAAKMRSPFDDRVAVVPAGLFAPAVWAVGGMLSLAMLSWLRGDRPLDRLGWLVLAGALLMIGLVAPDTLGVKHGHFLPQRIVLLGLVALVPWLDLRWQGRGSKLAVAALVVALSVQSVFVWDYARTCRERITPFLRVAKRFEAGTRSGTLLNEIRGRFRANPLLHADGLIAASTDSTFWTNYETAQYYFPVKVQPDLAHPDATAFEEVAILDEPGDADRRARLWSDLLRDHGTQVEKVVEWRTDLTLDSATRRNYRVTDQEGPIRIWSRIPGARRAD